MDKLTTAIDGALDHKRLIVGWFANTRGNRVWRDKLPLHARKYQLKKRLCAGRGRGVRGKIQSKCARSWIQLLTGVTQRGFVVPQFIWVSFAFVLVMLLLIDFAPSDAVFSGGLAKAKNAQTGVRSIAAKSSSYYSDTTQQPASIADLLSNRRQLPGWNGPYITEQQSKDPWGHRYMLRTPGLHGEIDVFSLGADGLVGGVELNSDIGNWESK